MGDLINRMIEHIAGQRRAIRKVHFPGGERSEDVDLPMPEGGQRDPRLEEPDVLGSLGQAAKGYRSLSKSLANMNKGR